MGFGGSSFFSLFLGVLAALSIENGSLVIPPLGLVVIFVCFLLVK